MGLTKQYLRYAPSALFGVVGSAKCNVCYVTLRGEKGRYVAVGACEHVFIWDTRKGEKVLILHGQKKEVTWLRPSPDGLSLAVGYEDGSIRIFSLLSGVSGITFNGHKAAVTALSYDQLGGRLVSGSNDTDVIVWDVINESGLYRLKGHKDSVTQAVFLAERNLLVTSGKDTLVKWWDLDTQHCFRTMVGHRTEVWDLAVLSDERRLLTGSGDSELRAWTVSYINEAEDPEEPQMKKTKGPSEEAEGEEEAEQETEERILTCQRYGSIMREGRERVMTMGADRTRRFLACHGNDNELEVFCILNEDEIAKKMDRKRKKAKKKSKQTEVEAERTLQDEILKFTKIKASSKIKSCDLLVSNKGELKVVVLLQNNSMECFSMVGDLAQAGTIEGTKSARLTLGGHRSDVRTMAVSSDNIAVLSASGDAVKIWNRSTLQCIRTMSCGYALCSLFVPGDRHVIIGTKSGKLQLFDLSSGTELDAVDAHDGAVWSISLSPDQRGFATGGSDKCVKFWEFELVNDDSDKQSSRRLSVKQTRVLQLEEDVLCVRYSPDGRLLAISLLDCTVKIFFVDTLKFFLSLYGHKLPVLCMDISHDNTIIVTGSSDRNIKIWGLDFGDCHRSLFAHDGSVMSLQFVPKTHLFFSAGKDGKLKQWDADKFQQVQTLEGHHGEVWCLAISPNGDHVVSSSHDKSLRLWERTREPLILEEEQEMQREAEFEESVGKDDQPVVAGEKKGETALAGKKTIATVKATERIMEAVELHREESSSLEEHRAVCKALGKEVPRKVHPILQAYGNISSADYILDVIKKVRSSELEESLLVLPFSYIPDLLALFRDTIRRGRDVELICRCLFFLLRIHFGEITGNHMLLDVMEDLKSCTVSRVREIQDGMGMNMAALQLLKREIEAKEEVLFFTDATERFEEKRRKRKKKEKMLLTLV